ARQRSTSASLISSKVFTVSPVAGLTVAIATISSLPPHGRTGAAAQSGPCPDRAAPHVAGRPARSGPGPGRRPCPGSDRRPRGILVFGRGDNPINFVSATDVAALLTQPATSPPIAASPGLEILPRKG